MHDTIEDCGITYNDLRFKFGIEIAEIVIAVTNDIRGRNRKERNESSYTAIKNSKYATFVKLCDKIANTTHSKNSGSSMYKKYKSEFTSFKSNVYVASYNFDEMWNYLENL